MDEWPGKQLEIENGKVRALAFIANADHLVTVDEKMVRVLRIRDGEEMAKMEAGSWICCLTVSKDGRWIAAGTLQGKVFLWDAKTYEKVFEHEGKGSILGVDFSPNSNRLVVASGDYTATVWEIGTCDKVLQVQLEHEYWVIAAKYSPKGDRIASATRDHIRVWDSVDGHLLVDVEVEVTPLFNASLLWFDDHLFVVSGQKIKRLDASAGSFLSEFTLPKADDLSCIALPRHGDFIACSTRHTITFWSTSTNAQLAQINHAHHIRSIAFSLDGQSFAFGGEDGKIIVKSLSRICPPAIQIDNSILDSWKLDLLVDTEVLLTDASVNVDHHLLSYLAFVRTRLHKWDTALVDAEQSIKIRPSVFGYIAKSLALAFKGEKYKAYRACDIAFDCCDSAHVRFLLLVKAIIVFITGEHDDALSRVDDLITTVLCKSVYSVVQAYMHFLIGNSRMETGNYEGAIQSFECARDKVRDHVGNPPLVVSLIFGWNFDHIDIIVQQRLCESLLGAGRIMQSAESLLRLFEVVDDAEFDGRRNITKWVSDFAQRCLSTPHNSGLEGAHFHQPAQADSTTIDYVTSETLLRKWVKTTLSSLLWKDALNSAATFLVPRLAIYQAICGHLEMVGRIVDAGECLQAMSQEIATDDNEDEQMKWTRDSRQWCCGKLEEYGDIAMKAEHHDEAVANYSAGLSLNPVSPQSLLVKRSNSHASKKSWKDALNDANEIIRLDPSSPWGYERKCVALRGEGKQEEMLATFKIMFSIMAQSTDPGVHARWNQYTEAKKAIDKVVQVAIRNTPRVLLNTVSGRLCDKSEQAAAFEVSPCFTELILSTVTSIDRGCIEQEVMGYYHYATFSHKWEPGEPLFEQVRSVTVYELEGSLTHDKLRMFCKTVWEAGFYWAWSDTCCINKADPTILQEAVIAMFKWYQGSSVTIAFLRGVRSRGGLVRSIWSSRAWTLQEYRASKVVRFYTEDWKPYLDLDILNHKDSPEIISEMEEVTKISARVLMGLKPGLDDIRTKLFLAAHRETTLIEDEAYSLLGTFSIPMSVVYGEGDKSLGRLLAQIFTSSGDTSILAWTGTSGSFNSCLPSRVSVFREFATVYIPPALDDAMLNISPRTSLNLTSIMKLYDRLSDLPAPLFLGKRVKLPCLTFKLGRLSPCRTQSEPGFRAQTDALGVVQIKTGENLSGLGTLYIVHPWIDFLLDQQSPGSVTHRMSVFEGSDEVEASSSTSGVPPSAGPSLLRRRRASSRSPFRFALFGGQSTIPPPNTLPSPPPSLMSETEKQLQAFRAMARLRQPFGALLLAPASDGVAAFKRVATESLIRVQVVERITPTVMKKLIDGVRVLDVL